MKKMLIGIAVGAIAGYLVGKLSEKENRERLMEEFDKYSDKAKNTFKDVVDVSKNKLEYLKDRADSKFSKAKESIEEATE